MAAKIVLVEIVRRPGAWGGHRIRTTTEAGAVRYAGEYEQRSLDIARNVGRRLAREHGARFVP